MKKTGWFFIAAFFIVFMIFFGGYFLNSKKADSLPERGKVKVAATIFPLYAIVKEIGGEDVDVRLLLPPGASPHTFEITPGLIKDLANTKIMFAIGHGIDDWTQSITASLPNAREVVVDREIVFRTPEEEKHIAIVPSEEEEEETIDPHYWMNPENGITIAETIALTLGEIDPMNTGAYQTRAADFSARVRERDEVWKREVATLQNKNILTFHDAYFYFADHFGLTIAGAFEPFPGKEPTPQYMAGLAAAVKERGLTEVFLEPQFSASAISSFADDYGLRVGVLDPEGQGYAEAKTYDDWMDYNIRTIIEVKNASR